MLKKIGILSLLAVAMIANAAEDASNYEGKLEETVVTATGFEDSQSNQIKNVTVITAQDIQDKGYNTVEEVLRRAPGVTMVENSAFGSVVDIRGQGLDKANIRVKILVDGVPINMSETSHAVTPLRSIAIDTIEKIEIINGGGTVLYGSGTTGGVVNIITKKTQSKPVTGKIYAQGSSFDTTKIGFGTGIQFTDKFLVNLGYESINGDGYVNETKTSSEYLYGGFTYKIADNQSLTFKATNYTDEGVRSGSVSETYLANDRKSYGLTRNLGQIDIDKEEYSLAYNIKPTKNLEFLVSAYKQNTDIDFSYYGYTGNYVKDSKKGIDLKGNYTYNNGKGNVTFGYSYLDNNGQRQLIATQADVTKKTNSIYVSNRYEVIKDLDLVLGYRYENAKYDIYRYNGSTTPNEYDKTINDSAYEAGLNYKYSNSGNVYFKYERGFTSPTPIQLSNTQRVNGKTVYVANDLKSEKFDTFEIGFKDMIGSSFVSLTGFYTITKDEIYQDGEPHSNYNLYYSNISETTRKGVELFAEQYFGKFRINESASYIHARVSKDNSASTSSSVLGTNKGDKIPYVPSTKLTLGAAYDIMPGLSVSADLSYVNGAVDNANHKIKGYTVTDLGVNYKHKSGWGIEAGIKNVFDKKYNYYQYTSTSTGTRSYVVAPERTYYVGVSYEF